jgi:energy-coupling factor transporter ATP-binding protein EcfA2
MTATPLVPINVEAFRRSPAAPPWTLPPTDTKPAPTSPPIPSPNSAAVPGPTRSSDQLPAPIKPADEPSHKPKRKPKEEKAGSPEPPPRPPGPENKEAAAKWPHENCRELLHWISLGMEQDADGEWRRRNPRQVDLDMRDETLLHFVRRGEFFMVGNELYYVDRADGILIPISRDSPELVYLMHRLGYSPARGYTASVLASILNKAARSPERDYHRIAYFDDKSGTIYLRADRNHMYRVTVDTVDEVPIGTEGVVLIAEDRDMAPLPPLNDLKRMMEEMRGKVGRACTQLRPDLLLTKHLTTRWALDSPLSAVAAHALFLLRFLFIFVASAYPLWPIISLIGEQGSAKSTLLELMLCLIQNKSMPVGLELPDKKDDLHAALANKPLCAFDNIDDLNLESKENKSKANTICLTSTGGTIVKRKLWTTNDKAEYRIQNHCFCSSRTDQFSSRSDVHRRTLTLVMQPAVREQTVAKKVILEACHAARPEIWAEIICRLQNMIAAHAEFGKHQYSCTSEMTDYESYTYEMAEYEGTLVETRAAWEAVRTLYKETITESNSMVFFLRIWLGQRPNAKGENSRCPNAGRVVSPETLRGEMEAIFAETRSFPYTSCSGFGKHIGNNLSALRVVGFDRVQVRGDWHYVCRPSEEEIDRCLRLYTDFTCAASARDLYSMGGGRYYARDNPANQESLDGIEQYIAPSAKPYRN